MALIPLFVVRHFLCIAWRRTPASRALDTDLIAGPIAVRGDSIVAKTLVYEEEARQKLASGVSKLAKAVRSTLGPRGRNAVIDKGWGAPTITKDGVTVAEEI